MTSKDIDDRFSNTEISELKVMIEKVEYENNIMKESFQKVVAEVMDFRNELMEYKELLLQFQRCSHELFPDHWKKWWLKPEPRPNDQILLGSVQ